jgi:PAS domain S-box-containing protein
VYSVLYVDDEAGLLEIGKLFLEQAGDFSVVTMESAEEALRSPVIHTCDAIVSDYQMPGMNGIAFLKAVRRDFGDIPFILFTGRGREEVVIEAINNGADFYLQKGGDPMAQFAELTHKILQAIRWRQAKTEQTISEKKFSEVFFKSPIISTILSLDDGKYIEVNDAFLNTTGYTRDEVIGNTFSGIHLAANPGDEETIIRAAREGRELRNFEVGMRTKSGEIREMLLSHDIMRTGAGAFVFSQAIDITERKQAQDSLRNSEQRQNDIINFLPDATFAIDQNGIVIAWNRAIEEMTGIPSASMVGKGSYEYSLPFYGERRKILIDLILESEASIREGRYTILQKEGNVLIAETESATALGIPRILLCKASLLYNRDGQITGAIESIRDVTETKKAERALIESERQYRDLFENSVLGIFRTTPEGTFTSINPTFARMSGYDNPEEMGVAIRDVRAQLYVNPEDRVRFMGTLAADGFVKDFEAPYYHKDGHILWMALNAIAVRDPAGKIRYFEGTIEDITEKKRAEEALQAANEQITASEEELRDQYDELAKSERQTRESEAKFRAFFEKSYDALTLSTDDGFFDCNEEALRLFGYSSREEFLEAEASAISPPVQPDGQASAAAREIHLRRAREEGKDRFEWVHWRKDGSIFPAEIVLSAFGIEGNSMFLASIRDISERRRAEDELRSAYEQLTASDEELRGQYEEISLSEQRVRESEERFRMLMEALQDAVIILDFSGTYLYANKAAFHLSGLPESADPVGSSIEKILEPSSISRARADLGKVHDEGGPVMGEYQIRTFHGELRWLEGTGVKISYLGRDCDLLTLRDVTETKKAEEALRESEEKYRFVVENSHDIIFLYQGSRFIFFNGRTPELTGYSVEELRTMEVWALIHPDDRAGLKEAAERRVLGKEVSTSFTARLLTKSGEIKDGEFFVDRILYKDQPAILGIVRDISERRRAEEAITSSEMKYRTIFENTGTATTLIEEDTTISLANSGFEQLSGFPRNEIENRKKWTEFVVKEDLDQMLSQHRDRRKRNATALRHYEFRFRQRSGGVRYIYLTIDVIPGTTRSIASMQDITERKQAEERLIAANNEYTNLLDQIQDVYYRSDGEGRLARASRSLTELLGYDDLSELIGRDIAGTFYFHPEDRRPLLDALAKSGKVTEFEITLKHRSGTPVLVATSTHYYYDKDGTILGVEGTIRDITERRKTENALKESQIQLVNAMDLTRMASWEYDVAEREFVFNDRIYALVLTTAENQGEMRMSSDRFIRQFVHPDDAENVREILRETASVTDPRYSSKLDFRLVRSDGEIRTMNARFGVIMGAGGHVARIYGAVQDITESKIMEQAVREANRKLNLLNSITRHDMVNQLTLLKGYAQLAEMKKPDQGIADFLTKIRSAAAMIEHQLAFTKTYQELGIKAPAWSELHHIVNAVGRKEVRFSKTCDATEIFADPMIERVFYNLFDNAIRHGEKVTEISIRCERGAGELIISVEDNGIGIPAHEKEKIFEKGYGKNTGFGLFLAKEILLLTGITIHETGIPGQGARFEMHVPKGMYRFTGKHHG